MAQGKKIHRIAVGAYFFICGFIFASWASRIPTIKDRFNLNEAELGAILFLLPVGSFIALPFAGWWVAKLGSRFITFISALAYASLLLGIALSNSSFVLGVILFFFGFFGDMLNISMNTQALDVEKIYQRPLMSSFHGMWSVGAMAGAVAGGWMMKREMTTTAHLMYIAAVAAFIALMMFSFLIKKDHTASKNQQLFAWPDKALLLLGAICFCCTLCEGAMADWSSLYYRQVMNDNSKVSTTGYTAFTFMMAFGRLVGDKIIHWAGNKKVLMADSLLIAGGLVLALGVQQQFAVIAGFGLVGFGVATIIPIVYSLAGRNKTMPASVALAAVSTVGFTGFLIGPPVIGFIAHETGLRIALGLVLLLGLVIFVLSGKVKEERS
ncbi:MAG: MFS transporter [Chitinophagaceae bacterium]|nr:MFS transporter [Chitinophagaceae bacterium]